MVKKCIYCSVDIQANSVVDMCQRCMHSVWGEKMTEAILQNMESERDKGNLDINSVEEVGEKFKDEERIVESVGAPAAVSLAIDAQENRIPIADSMEDISQEFMGEEISLEEVPSIEED